MLLLGVSCEVDHVIWLYRVSLTTEGKNKYALTRLHKIPVLSQSRFFSFADEGLTLAVAHDHSAYADMQRADGLIAIRDHFWSLISTIAQHHS